MTHLTKIFLTIVIILLTPLSAISAEKDSVKQLITHAVKKFETSPRKQWAFKVTRYENEEGDVTSSIEQYEPNKDIAKRWQLIRYNGEVPTKKQVARFIDNKAEEASEQSYSISLRELINLNTIELSEENDTHATANFDVSISKLGDNAQGKLKGKLSYNKANEYIETITINNIAPFSPIFSAQINDFTLTLKFTSIEGSILPLSKEMQMKGSFAFFTEIDEVSNDTYTNYEFYPN